MRTHSHHSIGTFLVPAREGEGACAKVRGRGSARPLPTQHSPPRDRDTPPARTHTRMITPVPGVKAFEEGTHLTNKTMIRVRMSA